MPHKERTKLQWCPCCCEPSVIRRNYMRKTDNKLERIEICLNHGCGYKLMLPFSVPVESEVNNAKL